MKYFIDRKGSVVKYHDGTKDMIDALLGDEFTQYDGPVYAVAALIYKKEHFNLAELVRLREGMGNTVDFKPLATREQCEKASFLWAVEGGRSVEITPDEIEKYRVDIVSNAAAALGSIRSEKKAAASRENGKKGGRPKKK